jgi:DNA-binding MarR family transcriptional regulator
MSDLPTLLEQISIRMRKLRNSSLTDREVMIMESLANRDSMTISELTADSDVTESTVSTSVSTLWRKNFVSKDTDRQDQRNKIISLTDQGNRTLKVEQKLRRKRFEIFLRALNPSEEESQIIEKLISRAIEALDKLRQQPQ